MTSFLWKVTAKRNNGSVKKEMSVEILKIGVTNKPNQVEIAKALNDKYDSNVHSSHCGSSEFDFTLLNK